MKAGTRKVASEMGLPSSFRLSVLGGALTKRCSKCREEKPATTEFFHRDKTKRNGLSYTCKTCALSNLASWRKKNKRRISEQGKRRWANRTPEERSREIARINAWAEEHPERATKATKTANKRWREMVRLSTLTHYSEGPIPKCSCCGETEIRFLSIDHIDGGGYRHRKKIKGNLYQWLRKNGWPSGYRTLCFNCNLSRGFYGICPHEEKRLKLIKGGRS